jgi:hypothetical protein
MIYRFFKSEIVKNISAAAMIGLITSISMPSFCQSKIVGKVFNSNEQPLPNANVLLLNFKDSSLVKGVITEQTGNFSFVNIPSGKYLITSTYTGFKQEYTSPFSLTASGKSHSVGTIKLTQQTEKLSDVNVITKNLCLSKRWIEW